MPLIALALVTFGVTYLVMRDAKSRTMNATGWGFFVVCTALAGLPVYLLARRKSPRT